MIEWKPVVGYEGYYEVSNMGDVFNCKKGFVLKKSCSHGYDTVRLTKETIRKNGSVHRIVSEAFVSNPLGLKEVNHKNANKKDNRVENLEWCTRAENMIHANNLGLINHKKLLDDMQVLTIKTLLSIPHKKSVIAKHFKVHSATIHDIEKNYIWRWMNV
jgi:hypothetical protein